MGVKGTDRQICPSGQCLASLGGASRCQNSDPLGQICLSVPHPYVRLVYYERNSNKITDLVILEQNTNLISTNERSRKNMFWSIKQSGEVLSKPKSRGLRATCLSTYDFFTLYTT